MLWSPEISNISIEIDALTKILEMNDSSTFFKGIFGKLWSSSVEVEIREQE